MNICFVSVCRFNEFTGGVDRVSCILAREFIKEGHNVFSLYSKEGLRQDDIKIKEHSLPATDVDSEANVAFVHGYIISNHIDVLVECSAATPYRRLCSKAGNGTGAKYVSVFHGDPQSPVKGLTDTYAEMTFRQKSPLKKIFYKIYLTLRYPIAYKLRYKGMVENQQYICSSCDAYVLLSKGFADFVKSCVRQKDKVHHITNPIELPDRGEEEETALLGGKKKQVVFCGRLEFQKRADRMLRIWKSVESEVDDWELIVIGDGSERQHLEEYACRLGLKRCTFTGSRPSAPYMREASIVCVTSTHEGFSMVLLEGLLNGCTPMAFDSYATVRDIIDDNRNGVLVKPFDERGYARKLIGLMQSPQIRTTLALQALADADKFSAPAIAQKWIDLFNGLK